MDWGKLGETEMSEWKIYEGTDEQIEEMLRGFIFRDGTGEECNLIKRRCDFVDDASIKSYLNCCEAREYLICKQHPNSEMIKRWADTGQPVWYRAKVDENEFDTDELLCGVTSNPNWSDERYEFSFAPFDE